MLIDLTQILLALFNCVCECAELRLNYFKYGGQFHADTHSLRKLAITLQKWREKELFGFYNECDGEGGGGGGMKRIDISNFSLSLFLSFVSIHSFHLSVLGFMEWAILYEDLDYKQW